MNAIAQKNQSKSKIRAGSPNGTERSEEWKYTCAWQHEISPVKPGKRHRV